MLRIAAALSLVVILACRAIPAAPISDIAGIWGGENAGLIATDS